MLHLKDGERTLLASPDPADEVFYAPSLEPAPRAHLVIDHVGFGFVYMLGWLDSITFPCMIDFNRNGVIDLVETYSLEQITQFGFNNREYLIE